MRGSLCGSLSLSLSIIAAVQLVFLPAGRAQNAPPPGEPEVNTQGNNVAPPPPPGPPQPPYPPGPPGPPGAAPPGYGYGPTVILRSDHPRARLQVQGPLKWQDVCVAPCNVPVNPQGVYRVGGGSIRPSESFNMPRPAGQVVVDTQVGSTVKHWVGFGLTIGGIVSAVGGTLIYAAAPGVDPYTGSNAERDSAHVAGVVYIITGLILLAVGLPLSMSSTSVDVH
jgi:hypothetical protein